ncbi:MAG: hypothetical protein U0871_23905 [Gemmataceae bacterium]
MTPDNTRPNLNPDTTWYRGEFVQIEIEGRVPTAEDLALPLYGRPDPARYLSDEELRARDARRGGPPADPS